MNITIFVNATHLWEPSDYEAGLLNGSEEMVFLFSEALTALGHNVRVICSTTAHIIHNEVEYIPRQMSGYLGGDILIAFKEPGALSLTCFEHKYLWTADPNILTPEQREDCDGMFAISKWHEEELQGLNPGYGKISHIHPGYDRKWGDDSTHRVEKRCLYASSPDRGLDVLLRHWPHIRRAHPNAELFITYADGVSDPEMGVFYQGRVDNRRMEHLYRSSELLLYPCTGGERFCLTALKAQINGCIPCVVPTMALQDTVRVGFKFKQDGFMCGIIDLLGNTPLREKKRLELSSVRHPTWVEVAREWESKWQRRSVTQ